MFDFIRNLFNEIIVNYSCKGGSVDRKSLDELQQLIQQRIHYLNQQNLDTYSDQTLIKYYDLYSKIQGCVFEDHSVQYLVIAIVVTAITIIVLIRWRLLRKAQLRK